MENQYNTGKPNRRQHRRKACVEILTRKRQFFVLSGLVVVLALLTSRPIAVLAQVDEYEVKAAFLLNFTRFVEWPKPSGSQEAFVICVVGDDPFESVIDQLIKGKIAAGLLIQIWRLKEKADAKQCQIAFIRAGDKTTRQLLEAVRGAPVLTVGETEEFLRLGGMIYLSKEQNRVTLVINNVAAVRAGLSVSAKLLSLAKLFKSAEGADK